MNPPRASPQLEGLMLSVLGEQLTTGGHGIGIRVAVKPHSRGAIRRADELTKKATDLPPRPHWAEGRFSEWTRDRHVRHPSFLGLRGDKKAPGVVVDPRAGTAVE